MKRDRETGRQRVTPPDIDGALSHIVHVPQLVFGLEVLGREALEALVQLPKVGQQALRVLGGI